MGKISEEEWDNDPTTRKNKEVFLKNYKNIILKWTEENENVIIEGRKSYSWNHKSLLECIDERNKASKALILSRLRNNGGIDLETADKIMDWGGFRQFPLRDPDKVLSVTSEAFSHLDKGDIYKAILVLLSIWNVGISRASKLLGLFDQDSLCIYDSRVGTALRTLRKGDSRLVLCPTGQGRIGDVVSGSKQMRARIWAQNYEKLIWVSEVIRDYLNEKSHKFRIADIEMALFMMGK
ncbi:hypothetical protein MUP77_02075 [Candidatus Bathyarchaeota archaeon]|nr:hypothetical protein [Candidatus Bathyarchaeota archaeon]